MQSEGRIPYNSGHLGRYGLIHRSFTLFLWLHPISTITSRDDKHILSGEALPPVAVLPSNDEHSWHACAGR
eukprot:6557282-Pyramimonas_sp.AAC.1